MLYKRIFFLFFLLSLAIFTIIPSVQAKNLFSMYGYLQNMQRIFTYEGATKGKYDLSDLKIYREAFISCPERNIQVVERKTGAILFQFIANQGANQKGRCNAQ